MNILDVFLQPVIKVIPHIPEAILSLVIGYVVITILVFVLKHVLKYTKFPKDLKGLFVSGVKTILWLILIIFIVKALGLGNLVVAISGSAIILAFILNNGAAGLVSDIISGIFLASDPDFHVGMKVSLNEGKTVGVIKHLDTRKVRIVDDKGVMHVLPNSLVEKGEWLVLEKIEQKSRANRLREKLKK